MIEVVKGDLLTAFDDNIPVIGHQVNCKGVMGAGLAGQIRDSYPKVYRQYKMACDRTLDLLGKIQPVPVGNSNIIVNIFGQDGYGRKGVYTDYKALGVCLSKLRDYIDDSVALPFGIGAGLAGGDWSRIYNMSNEIFSKTNKKLLFYKLN